MSSFLHIQNIKTRAIAPEYQSQWHDRVWSYDSNYSGESDFIVEGYPYSTANRQVIESPFALDGTKNDGALQTIAGVIINTISGTQMRRIYP